METLRSRYNRLSPLKRVAALGGIGLALFFGGKTVDHYDGPEQSAVAETLTLFGSVSMLAAGLSGAGYGLGRLTEKENQRDAAEARARIAAANEGLPQNRKFERVNFELMSSQMSVLESKESGDPAAEWAVAQHLGTTLRAAHRGMLYSYQLGYFSKDIARLVERVARARDGGATRPAQIGMSDTGVGIYPDSVTQIEQELVHVSTFLDGVVPLVSAEDGTEALPTWQEYLNRRVAQHHLEQLEQTE